MNFEEYVKLNRVSEMVDDGFALRKVPAGIATPESLALTEHVILMVMEGEMHVELDGKPCLMSRYSFADIVEKIPFRILGTSANLMAYQLVFTEKFLFGLIKNRPPFSFSYVQERRTKPVSNMDADFARLFYERIKNIEGIFGDTMHYFRINKLKCELWMLFLDIANAHLQMEESRRHKGGYDNSQKVIFMEFMRMLPNHIKREHSVAFYAKALRITPQYLNRIVKEITGLTASEWINKDLTGEILQLLESTNDSLQQIADVLNSHDQATFTKFFKRRMNLTPTEYRKECAERYHTNKA